MKPEILDSKKPVETKDLERLELAIGYPIPGEYLRFLKQSNGGRPIPNAFEIDGNSQSVVAWFLCVASDQINDIVNTVKRFGNRLPQDCLPFARDPYGNLICLIIEGEHKGQVFFWDHEREVEGNPRANLFFVAKSLREFLEGLHE
jgi:hypothetical protein